MLKILTIIGARPQIIKAAAISRAIKEIFKANIKETILHTGQHYDVNMSDVFFSEMGIPLPQFNLDAGSCSQATQTASILAGSEKYILNVKPDCVLVYGDTNSTLAASLAAVKLHVPVAHVEAGLRSYNKSMPEEINRLVCDNCSTFLFCPTLTAMNNLKKEGFGFRNKAPFTPDNQALYNSGDVMLDNTLYYSYVSKGSNAIFKKLKLSQNEYILLTIHRANNTDEPGRLENILTALNDISITEKTEVVFPVHPRTLKRLGRRQAKKKNDWLKSIKSNRRFHFIAPASYLEMLALEKNCMMIFTDSGGVQKEAFFLHKPSSVLRTETEWVELVNCGNSVLTDANPELIKNAFSHFSSKPVIKYPSLFGNGKGAEYICKRLLENF